MTGPVGLAPGWGFRPRKPATGRQQQPVPALLLQVITPAMATCQRPPSTEIRSKLVQWISVGSPPGATPTAGASTPNVSHLHTASSQLLLPAPEMAINNRKQGQGCDPDLKRVPAEAYATTARPVFDAEAPCRSSAATIPASTLMVIDISTVMAILQQRAGTTNQRAVSQAGQVTARDWADMGSRYQPAQDIGKTTKRNKYN